MHFKLLSSYKDNSYVDWFVINYKNQITFLNSKEWVCKVKRLDCFNLYVTRIYILKLFYVTIDINIFIFLKTSISAS